MRDSFDAWDYFQFLRERWKPVALVVGAALAIALIGSLILPKRYTAVATLVIEPPGGSDSRVATAVSPIYLESLKSFEEFASSNTLFARACEKFRLLEGPDAPYLESFKHRVLRVNKLKDTKVLQIQGTLNDPKRPRLWCSFSRKRR